MNSAKALLVLCLIVAAGCQKRVVVRPTATHNVHLAWAASTTPGVTYNAYRKPEACSGSAAFAKINAAPITGLSYDDPGLAEGIYCYQVTSYLASSTPPESGPSNQAEANIAPPAPPQNLIVTPAAVTVNVGGRQQFQAMRGTVPAPAAWQIDPPEGTIDAGGLYRAPTSIKGNNVNVRVTARESNDSATADITLRK